VSGAASSPQLKKWIFDVLGCSCLDGMGTTETGKLIGVPASGAHSRWPRTHPR
jgi:hypothetical protein